MGDSVLSHPTLACGHAPGLIAHQVGTSTLSDNRYRVPFSG